jgi:flagellar hook-length control protein FliK
MTEMLKLRSQSATTEISPNLNVESANATGESSGLASGLGLSALAAMAGASGEADQGSAGDDSQSAELKSEFNVSDISRDTSGAELADTLQVKSSSSEKVATAVGAGAMLSANTSEQRSNGPELMRQAQLLVNQGGGEMKMQLRPEGLGEVHLKVKVENGQVQIQMLTESDSAKKAIEGSLDELRSGLAQSKLHVDAMKIEVGTDLAKQRFEQQQQEAQRDQARQMAQNFMGQFREGRQGFHQSLGENRGWREYRPNRIADAPTPDAVVSASASARSASSSRRLDLVA